MTNRNFILLIIILIIILAAVFGFLYFKRPPATPTADGGGTNFFSQFNPFGNGGVKPPTTTTPPVDVSGYEPPTAGVESKLTKISSMPVAGYGVFMKERFSEVNLTPTPPEDGQASSQGEGENTEQVSPLAPPPGGGVGERSETPAPPETEFVPALRYVARATGNIYQTFADKIEERKFSSTIIPKVYEALFGNAGETVVMRYLKGDGRTIETFVGKLPEEILGGDSLAEIEVRGALLPANVQEVSPAPDGKSMFYLFQTEETTVGTILDFASDKKTQIFDSAFNEWLSFWPESKIITLTTKPSYLAPGYMYKLDVGTKSFLQVLNGINGLTTLASPDGKMALIADNTLALSIYHLDTKISESLGVRTLPEKCVWGRGSEVIYCSAPRLGVGTNYPDAWYQGEISFDDQIWKIDAAAGSASILADPVAAGGEIIDGIKLSLDEGENYLFFVNKKDSFLWRVKLK